MSAQQHGSQSSGSLTCPARMAGLPTRTATPRAPGPDRPGGRTRVAAFGAGWVTTERHIPTMRADGGFEVVALVDRHGDRARVQAERLGLARWEEASRPSELPFLVGVDAVTCGTAPFSHHEVIDDALRAGKAVLTEKPFTMTVAEGEQLRDLARERGLALCVVHNFQFARSVLKLRRWIAAGRIGTPRGLWAVQLSNPRRRLPTWFDDLPLGLFYDESPHLLYLVKALAGAPLEPQTATITPSTLGHANTPAQIAVQLQAGTLPVTVQMNFEAPLSEWQVMVFGDEGMGVVDVFRDIAVHIPNDGSHTTLEVLRTSLAGTLGHWAGYPRSGAGHLRKTLRYGNEEVFARFRRAVETGAHPDGIDVEDALDVLRLQHWIVAQAAEPARA
jgi:scyllo-inositol 2-dehydrogenase (NADP+)